LGKGTLSRITDTKKEDFSFLDSFKKFNDERVLKEFERFCNVLSKEEQVCLFKILIERMRADSSFEEITGLLNSSIIENKQAMPISIFSTDLSPLESIVSYMRDNLSMRLKDISESLGKSESSIWLTYRNAKKKRISLKIDTSLVIPLDQFDKNKSILENVVFFMIEKQNIKVKDLSRILNKSQSTIWTTYNRVRTK
jgi:predicted DNA-binding transcriptional regulator AlpA